MSGRVLLDPGELRQLASRMQTTAEEYGLISRRLHGKPMPEMPPGVAGRVRVDVSEAACRLGSEPGPMLASVNELKVRALWAEIADQLERSCLAAITSSRTGGAHASRR